MATSTFFLLRGSQSRAPALTAIFSYHRLHTMLLAAVLLCQKRVVHRVSLPKNAPHTYALYFTAQPSQSKTKYDWNTFYNRKNSKLLMVI